MKTYLIVDETSPNYYIGRRNEDELKFEIIKNMEIGDMRKIDDGLFLQREK